MRKLILIAALGMAACDRNQPAGNAAVSEETSADQVTAVNDTTAIDAATGEAANMAADVNYTFNELADDNESAGGSNAANAAANDNR